MNESQDFELQILPHNYSYSSIMNDRSGYSDFSGSMQAPLLRQEAQQTPKKGKQEEKSDQFPGSELLQKLATTLKLRGDKTEEEEEQQTRIVYLDGQCFPNNVRMVGNIVRNQKYSVLNFVPVVLFNQFKFFQNLFFLLVSLSQFIDSLKVGFLFSYIAPLIFVLVLTMAKEAWDDFKRYRRDLELNSFPYQVKKMDDQETSSADLKVGDLVIVKAHQRIPADLVLLYTSDEAGTVFIKTDQLDGETDWKLRKAVRYTQQYGQSKRNLFNLKASVQFNPPIQDIYKFNGLFKLETTTNNESEEEQRQPLNLDNTLWANTVLTSGEIIGLVVYAGRETRMSMNSKEARTKVGQIDHELNMLSKLLLMFMMFLSFLMVFINGFQSSWFILFFRYLLLLSSIIPISLRVNMDFAKMYFSYCINTDKDMEGAVARNSAIPEELGRIQFLLSDKTGTLTQNEMVFKKFSLEQIQYSSDNIKVIKKTLKRQANKILEANQTQKQIARKDYILKDLVTALCLCHNVTPVMENNEKSYQASSPDEIALVQIAESLDMKLVSRDTESIVIENVQSKEEKFRILNIFPFTSASKRMGIILQNVENQQIIFYLKGADTVMKSKVPEVKRGFLQDECESLAREGLRTLVITQKILTGEQYNQFAQQFENASAQLQNREESIEEVLNQLENNMEFLGVTGVEDKLQEEISSTLEIIRNAGIKVWMLTGDKIETAICIAISAGIKAQHQDVFIMKEMTEPVEICNNLNQFSRRIENVLVIDGITLAMTLKMHKELFFAVATKSPAVVCCRCSPTQKAEITLAIKYYTGQKTCGIGDGGNDVGMIQAADVGIGIVGKEGKQAALASDFSITKFMHLKKLLLWHGRLSYKRCAVMSQFVIHRGLVISVIQFIFICMFYFVALPVYNGWLMLGYATIYTSLPVFCLIFDEDVSLQKVFEYPPLYQTLQKGREINTKTFFLWCWKSIYQGSVIMILSMTLFEKSYLNVVTITFSALIIAELLNIYTEINQFKLIIGVAQLFTFAVYILSLFFLKSYLNVGIIDFDFIKNIIIITMFSWLPIHIARWLLRKYDPSEHEKIMKKVRQNF